MGDDVISCSPVSSRSSSFRNKRKKKFNLSVTHSFNTSSIQNQSESFASSSRLQPNNEEIQDLFEEEYDLILAELVPPPSKPRIDAVLLSQRFLNLKDLFKVEAGREEISGNISNHNLVELKQAECMEPGPSIRCINQDFVQDMNQTFIKEVPDFNQTLRDASTSDDSVSVIDQIMKDFEISPVKERKTPLPHRIFRTYLGSRKKIKPVESDAESSISWQEDELNERKTGDLDDFGKSQIMINNLLNLSNFFSEIQSNTLELDCTQRAVLEDVSLDLNFNFKEEEGISITESDEYVSLKFNDFYEHVFDGSPRIRLFESDDLDVHSHVPCSLEVPHNLEKKESPPDPEEESQIPSNLKEKESQQDLSILCGNTELFTELHYVKQSEEPKDEIKLRKDLSILCGNTELFTDICSEDLHVPPPELKNPIIDRLRKPTAKRRLSLDLGLSPDAKRKKFVRFDLEVIDDLNSSKCNIEEELFFEGFEPEDQNMKREIDKSKVEGISVQSPTKKMNEEMEPPDPMKVPPSSSGVFQASSKKEPLRESPKMYDEMNLEVFEKPRQKNTPRRDPPSFSGMFQTAGKKAIQISEESLKKSSKMYDEIIKEDVNREDFEKLKTDSWKVAPSSSGIFQTAGKEAIPISDEYIRKSSKMYEEIMKEDVNREDFEKPKPDPRNAPPSFSGIFQTAGKKAIHISDETRMKYSKIYEDVLKEDINLQELNKEKKRFEKENIQKFDDCEKTPKPKLVNKFSRAKSSPNLKAFCDNAAATSTPIIPKKFGKKLTQEEVSESIAAFIDDSNSFDESSSSKNLSVADRIGLLSKFDNPPPLSPITPVSGKTVKRLGLRRFASFQVSTKK